MQKYVIGGVVILVIAAAGIFVWKTLPRASTSTPTEHVVPQAIATSTYATTTFSIVYPRDFSADDSYAYDQVNPNKPIHGVKFTIPLAMATGTNLASDAYISVESLPHAKNCTGDIYLAANVKPSTVSENGVEYSMATSSGAGAGNLYDETVYALSGSSPCIAVRYFIHSSNIDNYPAGAVHEFDSQALLTAFDTIRQSLVLGSMPSPLAPPTTNP